MILIIIIGFLLNKYTPNHRNYILGYKSPIFMKNKDAWYEGNRFFGKTIMYGGIIGVIWSYVNILDTKSQTFLCCTSS